MIGIFRLAEKWMDAFGGGGRVKTFITLITGFHGELLL